MIEKKWMGQTFFGPAECVPTVLCSERRAEARPRAENLPPRGLKTWELSGSQRSHYPPSCVRAQWSEPPPKYVSSEPLRRAAEEHLNQIDFADLNYEDTDIMHRVIYPSEEFK